MEDTEGATNYLLGYPQKPLTFKVHYFGQGALQAPVTPLVYFYQLTLDGLLSSQMKVWIASGKPEQIEKLPRYKKLTVTMASAVVLAGGLSTFGVANTLIVDVA
jgi:hypothetical protein